MQASVGFHSTLPLDARIHLFKRSPEGRNVWKVGLARSLSCPCWLRRDQKATRSEKPVSKSSVSVRRRGETKGSPAPHEHFPRSYRNTLCLCRLLHVVVLCMADLTFFQTHFASPCFLTTDSFDFLITFFLHSYFPHTQLKPLSFTSHFPSESPWSMRLPAFLSF